MFSCICECVCILLLIYIIFLCVNACISILNMMDHKWSAYHGISSTHAERTSLKLFTLFKLNFIFSLSIIIYL